MCKKIAISVTFQPLSFKWFETHSKFSNKLLDYGTWIRFSYCFKFFIVNGWEKEHFCNAPLVHLFINTSKSSNTCLRTTPLSCEIKPGLGPTANNPPLKRILLYFGLWEGGGGRHLQCILMIHFYKHIEIYIPLSDALKDACK